MQFFCLSHARQMCVTCMGPCGSDFRNTRSNLKWKYSEGVFDKQEGVLSYLSMTVIVWRIEVFRGIKQKLSNCNTPVDGLSSAKVILFVKPLASLSVCQSRC